MAKKTVNEKLYGKGLVGAIQPAARSIVKDKFKMPPFSVISTRDGWWVDRKRRWLSIGIESEIGRGGNLTFDYPDKKYMDDNYGTTMRGISTTSVFDPVLTEIMYTWFCPPGGQIVDPFAGGSVRGLVASSMGYRYWGCDLRAEQIAANQRQVNENTTGKHAPTWVDGDSTKQVKKAPRADMVFTCPPYGSLEVYSDDPADLSNMDYPSFLAGYRKIIRRTCKRMADDSFAVIVVGAFRVDGVLMNLPGDTVQAFQDCGLAWYNDIVLVNQAGTGGIRTNTNFVRGKRKVVKMHQNVLVFLKGDNSKAYAKITGEKA